MEKLYEEIGKKIKYAAFVSFIVEAIVAVIVGLAVPIILVTTVDDSFLMFLLGIPIGAVVMALGVLVAWVSSWLFYGFGELIDKTCDIEKNTRSVKNKMQSIENMSASEGKAVKVERKVAQVNETMKAIKSDEKAVQVNETMKAIKSDEKAVQAEETVKCTTMTLADKLSYALSFKTDEEMISYLKNIDDEDVKEILEAPSSQIRTLVKDYLKYC